MRCPKNLFMPLVSFFLLVSCDGKIHYQEKKQSQLERIKETGVLRVLTRVAPTTYYQGPKGYTGFEYDLVQLFARELGVRAEIVVPESFGAVLRGIVDGKADIAAAGLTVTEGRKRRVRFLSPYQEITEQVVYRSGHPRPKSPADLASGLLEVVKGTSHIGTLRKLKQETPELEWIVNRKLDTDSLLYLVNAELIDYTVADSNQVKLIRRFYPELKVAFDISEPRSLAWAMGKSDDDSLYREAERFFDRIKQDKTLATLIDKHYGHANNLTYVGNYTFRKHVKSRLPKYRRLFQSSSEKSGIDWRLLAAIGYQESHWNKAAVSPTGVRGIMMLTEDTAKLMGIKNRTNPTQSISGGARYFARTKKRIPKHISDPDRTWLALAAYNVGFGHLQDARKLTKQFGGNPDKWLDVRRHLPLLAKKPWYSKTKYGYARGREPVRYVDNIRGYYDLLVWLTEENKLAKNALGRSTRGIVEQLQAPVPAAPPMSAGALSALAITNPIL